MQKHVNLPVEGSHSSRWLALFEATATELCPPIAAAHFIERARRIADSLEMGIVTQRGGICQPRHSVVGRFRAGVRESTAGIGRTLLAAVRDLCKPMRVKNRHALPATLHKSLLLPEAQRSADGEIGEAGHLGEVVSCDRKLNLNTVFYLSARLGSQAKQRSGYTPFDALAGHVTDALNHILRPRADDAQRIVHDRLMLLDQAAKLAGAPRENDLIL